MFINKAYCFIYTIVLYGKIAGSSDSYEDIGSEDGNVPTSLVIFPGTKWCGGGDKAKDYHDLGPERETDKCCRDHDHCDDYIKARSSKYNLYNSAPHTRLHCACDEEFHSCLKNVNNRASNKVGNMYFNKIHTKCYKKEYPLICIKYKRSLRKKCLKYDLDTSKEKVYQWFNVDRFP